MEVCSTCGSEITATARFCPTCGARNMTPEAARAAAEIETLAARDLPPEHRGPLGACVDALARVCDPGEVLLMSAAFAAGDYGLLALTSDELLFVEAATLEVSGEQLSSIRDRTVDGRAPGIALVLDDEFQLEFDVPGGFNRAQWLADSIWKVALATQAEQLPVPREVHAADVRARLAELKVLLDAGLVTPEDYNTRRQGILDEL